MINNIDFKMILTEITSKDAYQRFYQNIDANVYNQIVSTVQGDNTILLPETKWVLFCYKNNPQDTMNILPKLKNNNKTGYLDIFERLRVRGELKGKNSDLYQFKTLDEFEDFILSEIANNENIFKRTSGEWSSAAKKAKNDIIVRYEDDEWFVISPKSMEASCYWGSGTQWCTATRNEENNMFEDYNERGWLFIFINKQTKDKYQFFFEDEEYRDAKDVTIKTPVLQTIGASQKLIEYIKQYCEDNDMPYIDLIYDIIGEEEYNLTPIKINEHNYNFINENDEIAFPNLILYYPRHFSNKYISVNGEYNGEKIKNFMDFNGDFAFSDIKIIEIGENVGDICFFRTDEGVNYFNCNTGKVISDEYFYDGFDFSFYNKPQNATTIVINEKGQENILKASNGKLLSKQWFDKTRKWSCDVICYMVEINKKYNFIDLNGKLLLPSWYPKILDAGVITSNVLMVFTEDNHKFLYDIRQQKQIGELYEDIHPFYKHDEFDAPSFMVKKNGKYNFLMITEKYILEQWADNVEAYYGDLLLQYDNKWYSPVQNRFDEFAKLYKQQYSSKKYNKFENKITKKDINYIISEILKRIS